MRIRSLRLAAIVAALLLLVAPLWATGTLTRTTQGVRGGLLHSFAFTSHTDGTVTGNATAVAAGELRYVKIIPGTGGTQPTNLFDVAIVDADGLDILNGAGTDMSNAAPTLLQFNPPLSLDGGTLDVQISNAGSAKTGTVRLMVQ